MRIANTQPSLRRAEQSAARLPDDPVPWRYEPATIPPREYLFGRMLQRGTVSMIASADHIVTDAIVLTESVARAAGRDPLTGGTVKPHRTWLLSAQYDQSALDRQVAAVRQRFEISTDEIGDRLCAQSAAGNPPCLAVLNSNGDPEIVEATVQWLESFIAEKAIDVLVFLSLADFHSLDQGEDFHMSAVARSLRGLAVRTGCAIELGNHLTKKGDVSGAPALLCAMRRTRTIVPLKTSEADKLYLPARDCGRYLRVETKSGPVVIDEVWYRLDGDCDFVAVPWHPEKARRTVAPIAIVKTAARSSRSPAAGLPKIAKTSPTSPARGTPDSRKNRLNA